MDGGARSLVFRHKGSAGKRHPAHPPGPRLARDIPYEQVAAAQSDTDYQDWADDASVSLEMLNYGSYDLLCDMSTPFPRPILPEAWRRRVFDVVHDLHHPGPAATAKAMDRHFLWKTMKKDVKLWCVNCLKCQAAKVARRVKETSIFRPVPRHRFRSLHVDLVGPLPPSEGYDYLFTIIDRADRWPVAVPTKGCLAITCAQALLRGWIQDHGVPDALTSDRGPQFTSNLWAALFELIGAQPNQTTAYHPAANGLVERLHLNLKNALRAKLTDTTKWMDDLPLVLLGVRTAWRSDMDCSPAELHFGCALRQ